MKNITFQRVVTKNSNRLFYGILPMYLCFSMIILLTCGCNITTNTKQVSNVFSNNEKLHKILKKNAKESVNKILMQIETYTVGSRFDTSGIATIMLEDESWNKKGNAKWNKLSETVKVGMNRGHLNKLLFIKIKTLKIIQNGLYWCQVIKLKLSKKTFQFTL